MDNTENILEIQSVQKRYKGFALDGISLSLSQGYILGLIGPNGAGKTTTIKILMNMVKRDGGEVKVFGLDPQRNAKQIKTKVGFLGEEQHFYGNKTVAWTGKFVSTFYDNWDTNTFQSLLTKFQISRTKKTRELSKGMKVRFSLALAFSHHPELLILDEPTAGLDPVIRREVLELLRKKSKNEGKSVIISSHITDDIMRTADLVAFLIEGKIVLVSEKDELLSNWKRIHYKKGALGSDIVNSLTRRKDHAFGSSGVTDRYLEIKDSLVQGITEGAVKLENVNLDDILISLVKGV
ncbi:MAG: ABC transporter ATP-binding protein [Candidatus Aminicenantes bacterium]|nr:ABC transporter ATP-binding protein [Candidatus Aminicenantes bacterium]MDH5744121.1 ABC transporter ATP-binding protein [Candidatus Aminicenantes bacterium]